MLLYTLVASINSYSMGSFTINCNRETCKFSRMIVDSDKSDQIIVKHAQNKKNPSDVFRISLHFVEDVATIKSDFGE